MSSRSSSVICTLFLSSPASSQSCLDCHYPCSHWFSPSITSCIVLILLVHVAGSRCVIRSFQPKILQHLPDVSLIRVDRDAVATTPDDTVQDCSTPLKVCVFSDHFLLDLVFSLCHFDEEFHCRSFSTERDVVPVHGCHDMFTLDATLPHVWARDPSRQLEIAECRCKIFLPIWCSVARAVQYKLYCNSPHMCGNLLAAIRQILCS